MLLEEVKKQITEYLVSTLKLENPEFEVIPTNKLEDGDFYTNVALKYCKMVNKKPQDFAEDIAKLFEDNKDFSIKIAGPGFVNFYLSPVFLGSFSLTVSNSKDFGSSKSSLSYSPVIVEYSSPNIAKPFGIGHLRSTIIGDSITRLLRFSGIKVLSDNHLGDWGTQFGKQIYAVKNWGDIEKIKKSDNPIKELVDLYVKFHDEVQINPAIESDAREWFKKLEEGDKEALELWEFCIRISLKNFEEVYKRLDILEFDMAYGESYFRADVPSIVSSLKESKLAKMDDGALMVYFEEGVPPMMVIKSDGTTLYGTRDLATDKFRLKKYGSNTLIINEVGSEQSLYFEQLFKIEEKLRWIKEGQRVHVKHGLYRFKDRKMSTRKGDIIWLEDILDEAFNRAIKLISSEDLNIQDVAQMVSIGAIKWNDLKRDAKKDVTFDWEEVLSMEGNSGPYVQYTHARCSSILQKSNFNHKDGGSLTLTDEDKEIARVLFKFSDQVAVATKELAPHYICHYLFELCQAYNSYYGNTKIIGSDNEYSRLVLTSAVKNVIKTGLELLGIKAPEKM